MDNKRIFETKLNIKKIQNKDLVSFDLEGEITRYDH